MANAQEKIDVAIELRRKVGIEINRRLSSSALNAMAYAAAWAVIANIRQRTMARVDANGRRFSPYTTAYLERKKQIVKKQKILNEFTATRTPAWLRLSGRMFRDMYVKRSKGFIGDDGNFTFEAIIDFRTQRSRNIASYQKRQFWAISKQGTAWGNRLKNDIEDAVAEVLDAAF